MRCAPLLVCLLVAGLVLATGARPAHANALKGHASPYLAMHGSDPVDWLDWTPAAAARARRENKLLYLSIGYFSCHWCHVMQRESYQNKEIAAFLNKHFVAVKVDRELEPALDARLIAFAESTRGMGGWPLNVFITPEGNPLYAVLYMPPAEFLTVLKRLQGMWAEDATTLRKLARSAATPAAGPGAPQIDAKQAARYAAMIRAGALSHGDSVHGGFGEQSKFPSVPQLEFLLAQLAPQDDAKLAAFVRLTLDEMASRGLYDHLGGGFFRYTVDPAWKTPHFEKMLYDNAMLARLYLRAARALKEPRYEKIARETLAFMQRGLMDPRGGMIASLSAVDDRNIEGGYYLWQRDELAKVLTASEFAVFTAVYGIKDAPPFDDGYLPMHLMSVNEAAVARKMRPDAAHAALKNAETKLLSVRNKRKLPRDTKLLAAWNGLALSAFAEAARLTGDESYRRTAKQIRDYLANVLWNGRDLSRSVEKGQPVGAVSLEDYAYVARGLLDWMQLHGSSEDRALVYAVTQKGWSSFYGDHGWRLGARSLIESESGQDLVADGPMPSPAAVLIGVSLALDDAGMRKRALSALNSGHGELATDPFWHATHVGVMATATSRGG